MRLLEYVDKAVELPAIGHLPATHHVFSSDDVDAVNTALAAGRPLLLRGEPGSGKTQLARAVAHQLKRAFVAMTVDARTESGDLQWSLDAVRRLAEAQVAGAAGLTGAALEARLDERQFTTPGPLWWAFDWGSAENLCADDRRRAARPVLASGGLPENGVVVLIDEIDKADSSVPNGLLESLGHGRFVGPNGGLVEARPPWPLVLVTTNEERSLPDAFLRRCLVHHLTVPEKQDELIPWLLRRGRAHFPAKVLPDEVLQEAALLLVSDRRQLEPTGLALPGAAEYLDLLRAIAELEKNPKRQLEKVRRLARFTFSKHSPREVGMQHGREPR